MDIFRSVEADRAEPHQTTGAEREDGLDTERRGWNRNPRAENIRNFESLGGERSGENETSGTVRKLDSITLFFSSLSLAERVGFVPVAPSPINDLGLIRIPQFTKTSQSLSIRYKTGTAQLPPLRRDIGVRSSEPLRSARIRLLSWAATVPPPRAALGRHRTGRGVRSQEEHAWKLIPSARADAD